MMMMTLTLGVEKKEKAEAYAEKLGGWDPRAAFISDTVRTIALLGHERLRLSPLFTPAIGIAHAQINVATTNVSPWTDVSHACSFATTTSPFGFSTAVNWTPTNADFATRMGQVWLVIWSGQYRTFDIAEVESCKSTHLNDRPRRPHFP